MVDPGFRLEIKHVAVEGDKVALAPPDRLGCSRGDGEGKRHKTLDMPPNHAVIINHQLALLIPVAVAQPRLDLLAKDGRQKRHHTKAAESEQGVDRNRIAGGRHFMQGQPRLRKQGGDGSRW